MVGELIQLPVRIGMRATRLWLRVAEETVAVAASTTGRLIDAVSSRGARVEPFPQQAPAASAADARGPDVAIATPEDVAFPAERTATAPAPRLPEGTRAPGDEPSEPGHVSEDEPGHVSEEPVLVEELAEPGAEEGAGPEVHVDEPWDGYESMNAKDIIARLARCDSAELAAVALYERGHRGRHTVLAAVERELRANGATS